LPQKSRVFDNGNIDSKANSAISEVNSFFKLKDYIRNTYNFKMLENIIENENFEFVSNVKIPKRGYKKKTIYESGTNYKEEFWKKYNSFPLTESQKNFIKTANKK